MKNYKLIQATLLSALAVAGTINDISASEIGTWNVKEKRLTQSDMGGVGLLQTPTARMAEEGDLYINYRDNEQYRFWTVSLTLFPWLESTVRYTDVRTLLFSGDPGFSGNQSAKDKGIDFKVRLLQESQFLPEMSVGIRDVGGNGYFESEFINASKRWGDFDFHLGMGWGYLGRSGTISNPFCDLKESFCDRGLRDGEFLDQGGKFEFDKFFKGETAIFGGIEYQTPWAPLSFKLEYEGNDYSRERADQTNDGLVVQDSKWNIGANYLYKGFDFSLAYERGNTLTFGVSYKFNLQTAKQVKFVDTPYSMQERRKDYFDNPQGDNRLRTTLRYNAGFALRQLDADKAKDVVTIYGSQEDYRERDESLNRIGRTLANSFPDSVKEYRVVELSSGKPMVETVIDAEKFIDFADYIGTDNRLTDTYIRQNPAQETVEAYEVGEGMGFYYGAEMFWTQSFGNPEAFYLYQTGLYLNAGYQFTPSVGIDANAKVTVLENFDKFNFGVDGFESPIPRVRTYVREYVRRSRVMVDSLYGHWSDKIGDNLFASAYGGYLETMFAGVGGEVFYRPVDSKLSVGVDLNWVKQRSFEDDFSLRDYDTITGHASVYYQLDEWLEDTQLSVNIGEFLAKDKGVQVDFAKRFDSGVVVGAYAAFTDVTSQEYGEGSFTKGFYMSIPFDLFSLKPSKGRGQIPWVPIGRDGGQMLNRPVRLADMTDIRSPFYDR